MALKAGYVGVKRFFITKVNKMLATLNDIIPEGAADDNQLVTASDLATGLSGKVSIGNTIDNTGDLNNVTETGFYSITTAPSNMPENKSYAMMLVKKQATSDIKQFIIKDGTLYARAYGGSPAAWGNWYKYTGTALTPATQNSAAPDTREASPEVIEAVTKTTKSSTKKTATTKEGE